MISCQYYFHLSTLLAEILFCITLSESLRINESIQRPATAHQSLWDSRLAYKKGGSGFTSRADWDPDWDESLDVKRNKKHGYTGFGGLTADEGLNGREQRRRKEFAHLQKKNEPKEENPTRLQNQKKLSWARSQDQRAGREAAVQKENTGLSNEPKGATQRLSKLLAHSGIASRRAAEVIIADGRVRVNNRMVTEMGEMVNPVRDVVQVDGKRVALRPTEEVKWVMLHKPKGVLTTVSDEKDRKCVMDFIPRAKDLRLVPVGRLDRDSSGLLLLTNDLAYVHRLTHPSFEHWKVYRVSIAGVLEKEKAMAFENGMLLEGENKKTAPCELKILECDPIGKVTKVEVSLREGRNRQIRRMFSQLGHEVKTLKRVSFGPLGLGSLSPGEYRELKKQEVQKLREMNQTPKSASSKNRSKIKSQSQNAQNIEQVSSIQF